MGEDMKFIVSGLNEALGKNYTIISFKALSSADLLQALSDLLSTLMDSPKINMNDEDLEQSAVRILSVLRVLKYQPNEDPASFRQNLIKGDPRAIYTILQWLLTNQHLARQRAYLSRFLVKIDVPPDYLQDAETAELYERYLKLIDDFKMLHKDREAGRKDGEAAAELKADLRAMEKEREVIIDRIDRVKSRIASHTHLLEAAQALRVARDRDHDLSQQRSEEKKAIAFIQVSLQRAERKLEVLQQTGIEITPEVLERRLAEEVRILMAVCNERLPLELSALQIQNEALKAVVKSPYVGPDEIVKLRQKLDVVVREVQALAETKITESGADKMVPFRQQAAAIASIKRNTLEKLEKSEADLAELLVKLGDRREKVKFFNEESIPKGEELKRYVSRLKTKSGVYKRCRAELAGLRAECGVLSRTLAVLDAKLMKNKSKESISLKGKLQLPDDYTEMNAATENTRLARILSNSRAKLSPVLRDVETLRERFRAVEDRYIRARKEHETIAAKTQNSMAQLTDEVAALQADVDNDIEEIAKLREQIAKLKLSREKIQYEMRFYANPGGGQSLRDKLNESISIEEKKLKVLKEEEIEVKRASEINVNQSSQWNNLILIFTSKLESLEENKKKEGIVLRGGGTETLILQ